MSDKIQLIKEEIERRYNCEKCYSNDREANVAAAVLQELLLFIDSLPEENNEDLEEAAQKYSFNIPTQLEANSVWKKETEQHFKDGAEWQKQKDDKHIDDLQWEAYLKGEQETKQQMMKDAVEGTIKYEIGSAEIPQCDRRYQVLSDPTPIANAKLGDKVKIIILKTE